MNSRGEGENERKTETTELRGSTFKEEKLGRKVLLYAVKLQMSPPAKHMVGVKKEK